MSEFLVSLPLRIIRERVLQPANARVQDDGEYTEDEAALSLLVDVDSERVRPKAAYARIWGWTRHKVRYNWEELWQTAALWASSYGRQIDGPIAKKLPEKWRRWLVENHRRSTATQPPDDRHPAANPPPEIPHESGEEDDSPPTDRQSTANSPPGDRHPTATHTIHPSSSSPSPSFKPPTDQSANPRAREASETGSGEADEMDGRSVGKEKDFGEVDLMRELKACGLSEAKAEELTQTYPADEILDQIASYRWRCDYGQAPTSAGWIAWALETDEPLPKGLRRSKAKPERRVLSKPTHRSTFVEPEEPPAPRPSVSELVEKTKEQIDRIDAKKREAAEERRRRRRREWARAGSQEPATETETNHEHETA